MADLPSFGDVLTVRDEVLEGEGLLGMVNLAELREGARRGLAGNVPGTSKLRDPRDFFDLTYPTEDVRQTLRALDRRAREPDAVPGTLLMTGRYGAGKSHVLLAAHHALSSPEVANAWADRWELDPYDFPDDARVVSRSFIDRNTENLWDVFFEALDRGELADSIETFPDGETIQRALGDRRLFLVVDELERWYAATSESRRQRNRNFLQALSEVAMRDGRVTLLTSVLGERAEPADTLRRTNPMELAFRSTEDRRRILQFRLFDPDGSRDEQAIERTVAAHVEAYGEAELDELDAYRERFQTSYPFTPELLDVLLEKVPTLGDFQNTRGTLRFLADIVRETHDEAPIVSSRSLDFRDSDVETTLSTLDPTGGEIVRRAVGDNWRAVGDVPHGRALFAVLILYSIADPTHPGAAERDLMLAVLGPSDNPNAVRESLRRIRRVAYNLHRDGDRYVFKTEENPRARINAVARSPEVTESACRRKLVDAIETRWGDASRTVVHTGDVEATRRQLRDRSGGRPLFILSTASLTPDERLELQNLEERRNLVLLIEPYVRGDAASSRYDLLQDDDLLEITRRIEACDRLLESGSEERHSSYRSIKREEEDRLAGDVADRYGFYVRWKRSGTTGDDVDDDWYDLETVDEFQANRFMQYFKRNFSSLPEIKTEIRDRWRDYRRRSVSDLVDWFERTLEAPVPYDAHLVPRALRDLADHRVLGLETADGDVWEPSEDRSLSDEALMEATVVEPPEEPEPTDPLEETTLHWHDAVSAEWDDTSEAVVVKWQYPGDAPDSSRFRTLVQRYQQTKGMRPHETHPVEFDETHALNRYIGDGDRYVDDAGLERGAWYYYYVFLVEDPPGEPARAVLSKRCDVEVPSDEPDPRPDRLRTGAQNGHTNLYAELERLLMTELGADDAIDKIEFDLAHLVDHEAFDRFVEAFDRPDDEIETTGRISIAMRGDYDRQEALNAAHAVPDLEDVVYEATIHLAETD